MHHVARTTVDLHAGRRFHRLLRQQPIIVEFGVRERAGGTELFRDQHLSSRQPGPDFGPGIYMGVVLAITPVVVGSRLWSTAKLTSPLVKS